MATPDKFKATWVSHSSIGDFKNCPRLYFLHNVYKDPKSGRKVNITSPAMSLGVVVHNVLEGLIEFPSDERKKQNLMNTYENEWNKVSGKRGGFTSEEQEEEFKERGKKMIQRAIDNFDLFEAKAIKMNQDLPHYWLSEEDEILLCGKVDWLEYLPETNKVHVVDFKTGKNKEDAGSLQLNIYALLLKNCQKREVEKASYWYLETDNELTEKELPDIEESNKKVLEIAKKVKEAREKKEFVCPQGEKGCWACQPFEKILDGRAEYVGVGEYNQDLYVIPQEEEDQEDIVW